MHRILKAAAAGTAGLAVLALTAAPASARGFRDQPVETGANIVGTVVAVSGAPGTFDDNGRDYDILREAVIAAGLADELSSGTWTVFAPNDRAFSRLVYDLTGSWPVDEEAALTAVAGVAGDLLDDVLLYHVVAGEALRPVDLLDRSELTTAGGGTLGVSALTLMDAEPDLRDARIVVPASDIHATNGTINTIDRVLLPIDL